MAPYRCEASLQFTAHQAGVCFIALLCFLASTSAIDEANREAREHIRSQADLAKVISSSSLCELLSQNSGALQRFNAYLKAVCPR